ACSLIHLFTFPMMLMAEEQPALMSAVEFLVLKFDMINPLQWLTYYYMHGDPLHLIGNMIFLWTFGLIVEGKVGWWRFLAIYNSIGLIEGAILQVVGYLFLGGDNGALGASGAIYGLLAISLIWAPVNEMQIFYFIFFVIRFWIGTTAGSVMAISGFFIGMQVVVQMIRTMHAAHGEISLDAAILTSEVGHLGGAVLGLAVGIAMLRLKWVDCEEFDVFSVIRGEHKRTKEEKLEEFAKSKEGQELRAKQYAQAQEEFRQNLAAGQPLGALATHRRAKQSFPEWSLPENDFVQLIVLLRKLHMYDQAIPAMLEYLRTYRERIVPIRLALAQVLTEHKQRPRQALTVLAKVNGAQLDAAQQKALAAIHAKAKAAFELDPYEVEPEDW
ncbi:MAG: rhomboid family intramembrane serine protease, partial [Pirellulaceae bacterium]